ncbi:MAG: addiction module protein [Planctomycetota bacterium]
MSANLDINKLTPEERLALLEEIWNSLTPRDIPLTEAQQTELNLRLDDLEQDRDLGIPWDDVLRKIKGGAN